MSIRWGDWDYFNNDPTQNGMRVGSTVTWSAVSHTSESVTATVKIYTENRFAYSGDNQRLSYNWTGNVNNFVNNSPGYGDVVLRGTQSWTYPYPTNSYHTSPGTAFFISSLSLAINGVTPFVNHALDIPARPADYPTAPTSVTSTPGNNIVTIGFGAPTDDGGVAISYYEYSTNINTDFQTVPSNPFTVDGFNGNALQVNVRAVNGAGRSSPTASATSTPRTVPGVPTDVTSTPSSGKLTVSYAAPTSDGGNAISAYEFSTDGTNYSTITTNPFDVSGTNGTPITVYVRARNDAGAGSAASTTNTPRTVAGAPTSFAGNSSVFGQISLSWAAPASDGGATITSYVLRNGSTILQSANLTSFTHTGLLPYTEYSYAVTAVNAAGEGNIASLTVRTLGGIVNIWYDNEWVTVLPKVWDGEEWVDAQARMWDGTEWKHGI